MSPSLVLSRPHSLSRTRVVALTRCLPRSSSLALIVSLALVVSLSFILVLIRYLSVSPFPPPHLLLLPTPLTASLSHALSLSLAAPQAISLTSHAISLFLPSARCLSSTRCFSDSFSFSLDLTRCLPPSHVFTLSLTLSFSPARENRWLSFTLPLSHSLSVVPCSLSLTPCLSLTRSLSHSCSLSPSHAHDESLSLLLSCSFILVLTRCPSLLFHLFSLSSLLTASLFHSLFSLSLSRCLSHSLSLGLTLTRVVPLSRSLPPPLRL